MTHDPIEELLGAYALDAVDDDERAAVEAHLATCPRCRAEVDAHREVAAHLVAGAPAPDGLWERIADRLEGEAPPPLRLVADPEAERGEAEGVVHLRRWQRVAVVITAVAAAVAIVALSASSIDQAQRIDDMEAAQGIESAALEAFGSSDARVADLTADDGTVVRAAVLPDGEGYLLAGGLPALDDQIYQLWGAAGDQVVSLGPMGSDPTVVSFPADTSITTLMVTVEDEVVEQSSNPPVVIGELS